MPNVLQERDAMPMKPRSDNVDTRSSNDLGHEQSQPPLVQPFRDYSISQRREALIRPGENIEITKNPTFSRLFPKLPLSNVQTDGVSNNYYSRQPPVSTTMNEFDSRRFANTKRNDRK